MGCAALHKGPAPWPQWRANALLVCRGDPKACGVQHSQIAGNSLEPVVTAALFSVKEGRSRWCNDHRMVTLLRDWTIRSQALCIEGAVHRLDGSGRKPKL